MGIGLQQWGLLLARGEPRATSLSSRALGNFSCWEMAFDEISAGFPTLAASQSEISGGREGGCHGRSMFKAELPELISSAAP